MLNFVRKFINSVMNTISKDPGIKKKSHQLLPVIAFLLK